MYVIGMWDDDLEQSSLDKLTVIKDRGNDTIEHFYELDALSLRKLDSHAIDIVQVFTIPVWLSSPEAFLLCKVDAKNCANNGGECADNCTN